MTKVFLIILKYILKQLAKLMVWRFKPQIIAITGSVGKTSVKEAVYAVLSHPKSLGNRVRKSEGNLNNELGMPLTIIGEWKKAELKLVGRDEPPGKRKIRKSIFWLKVTVSALIRILFLRKSAYPQVLILEYAADRPGDIKYLSEIAMPHIGIVTTVGEIPVHVEFFSGPEAVFREKSKLIELLPANGFAILNFDSEIAMQMKERTRARVVTFGFSDGADLKISNLENRSENDSSAGSGRAKPLGVSFKLEYGGSFVPVILKNSFGKAQAYAAGVGACVGLIYDLNLVEIAEALNENYSPAKGRMNLLEGVKGTYVIDDTYNASPLSVQEALETLSDLPAKRKIVVLGDMLELGKYAIEAHESIGRLVVGNANILITVGPRAKFIAESAKKSGMDKHKVLSFDTAGETGMAVQDLMKTGDLVLVKASRAVGLDKVVEEIKGFV